MSPKLPLLVLVPAATEETTMLTTELTLVDMELSAGTLITPLATPETAIKYLKRTTRN